MVGWFKRTSFALFAAVLSLSSSATAEVLQPTPGGVVVPVLNEGVTTCADKNVEICLDLAEGDPALIDSRADALVAPETFQPTCQLTFTPIVKGGSIYDVFGWYNVKPNALDPTKFVKPGATELFGMFVANDFKTGAQLAGQAVVLDLEQERLAGRYKGGQIGFFVASGAGALSIDPETHRITGTPSFVFHTQHALNDGSTATTTYYNVLTWESVAHENTFYFGWEDLPANSGSDHDFDDFVFSVEGVQCGGGGQACDTLLLGVCAAGVQQCKKGVMTCVQSIEAGPEQCNALDDNCNGAVDDGELCDEEQVCHRGRCVPRCGTGEFRCPESAVCTDGGLCVDQVCAGIECPAGQVCDAGACVDSCTGITCPHGRACRNGACLDPCQGIECDEGLACVLGVCKSCECSACSEGSVCHENQCVDSGCESQTCAPGTHCAMGACVDDCDGALCPEGQLCSAGECIVDPNSTPGAGGADGTGGIVINTGGATSSGSTSSSGGDGDGVASRTPTQPGCSCTIPNQQPSNAAALLALALFGLARRRRTTRQASRVQ